jgi:hypothetical protein
MANKIFRDHIIKNIKGAMQDFSNTIQINHPALKGRIREIALTNLFKPILPFGVGIGYGKIIDYLDSQSRETDIIIYTKTILAPILYDEKTGLFPIESCLYAIEIKSRITASEVKDAIAKGEHLRSLKYIHERYGQLIAPVIPAIYAFDTDLVIGGKTEIDRYQEYDTLCFENPVIPVICVAGRGYWWFKNIEKKWIFHPPSSDFDEIVDFLGGVVNTIPDIITARRNPGLGWYLIEPRLGGNISLKPTK